ncbi:MAG: Gfo/Idh/MocA family oxidoreductase, partial [Polyangiaceae bacterium]
MRERRTTSRLRAAVLGLGAMGRRHLRVLAALGSRFEVVGGYDPRRDLPPIPGIDRLRSEAEAIENADVIVIATPNEAHGEGVARALAAGRHVLVEKPVCA